MKHALVIEDSPLIIEGHLKRRGYVTVDVAATQTQAIRYAEKRCPHLKAEKAPLLVA